MTSATPPLAARAETLLNRLAKVEAQEADLQARVEIKTVQLRASNIRETLDGALSVIQVLEESGVSPIVPASPAIDLAGARRALRSTASNLVGASVSDIASRIKASSVNNALGAAEKFSRYLESALNRSVEKRRQEVLPPGIDQPVIAYPGASDALAARLRRLQVTLQRKVENLSPSDLVQRLEEIVCGTASWATDRPRLDEGLDRQDPEVKEFLRQAATVEGAPWSLITPTVRAWLADSENTVNLKVVLRS
jgi:hypothetical protein